jgi:hypothetical protein
MQETASTVCYEKPSGSVNEFCGFYLQLKFISVGRREIPVRRNVFVIVRSGVPATSKRGGQRRVSGRLRRSLKHRCIVALSADVISTSALPQRR